MITGVFPLSNASIVAREARCQGISLESWAQDHGLSLEHLESALNGERNDLHGILVELADLLGISVVSLQKQSVSA